MLSVMRNFVIASSMTNQSKTHKDVHLPLSKLGQAGQAPRTSQESKLYASATVTRLFKYSFSYCCC